MERRMMGQASGGSVYWFFRHAVEALGRCMNRHKVLSAFGILAGSFLLFFFRAHIHPYYMMVRTHLFLVVLGAGVCGLGLVLWVLVRNGTWKSKIPAILTLVALAVVLVMWGGEAHQYMAYYYRYKTLKIVELSRLPTTGYERIQPRNSIYSLSHEVMTENESPSIPDFVRVDGQYRWTFAVEPSYPYSRILYGVASLFSIPGTAPFPNFSKENRKEVSFQVGENLLWGRNTDVCTVRKFGWRYFNYQPSGVTYLPDASGRWVQVVSLIHWEGMFFPQPTFGGVVIIRQVPSTLRANAERVFLGCGEWVRPENVSKYPFLQGQNILSYEISRYAADSFRFQNGFLAPLPGYHMGDIRIPDLPADVNDQPFTAYFEGIPGREGALYHYFALEPFSLEKQGLNTSVFIPADGTSTVYVYRHNDKGEALVGVSTVAPKVAESRKEYNWIKNRPVEHRPYIRVVNGKERLFWLTTVVTKKDERAGDNRFIAGSAPEIVLTDAATSSTVWVDSMHPETWVAQLEKDLGHVWANK